LVVVRFGDEENEGNIKVKVIKKKKIVWDASDGMDIYCLA